MPKIPSCDSVFHFRRLADWFFYFLPENEKEQKNPKNPVDPVKFVFIKKKHPYNYLYFMTLNDIIFQTGMDSNFNEEHF